MPTKPPPSVPERIPLATQTASCLLEAIRRGHWQGQLPGERDLARQFNVGRDTLRLALRELERSGFLEVTQRSRRRIILNPAAEIRSAETVLGVLSPAPVTLLNPLSAAILDQIRAYLEKTGGSLEFHSNPSAFSKRPNRSLSDLVSMSRATAWVVFGSKEPMQSWFISRRLPCLILGSCSHPKILPSIDQDYRATGRHAAALLLRKRHRRIALVITGTEFGGELECEKGIHETIATQPGISLRVLRYNGEPDQLRERLARTLRVHEAPTAYAVIGTKAAIAVLTHLLSLGVHVPRDVALLCCDDDPTLAFCNPRVTRYTLSTAKFIRETLAQLRRLLLKRHTPPRTIRLMPDLVPGETV